MSTTMTATIPMPHPGAVLREGRWPRLFSQSPVRIVRGKGKADRREDLKKREAKRDIDRAMTRRRKGG